MATEVTDTKMMNQ